MGKKTRGKPKGLTKGLTKQREKFCQHYALHKNGAEAYAHAYPKSRRQQPQYRAQQSFKLMRNTEIQDRINELKARVVAVADKEFDITAERVLQEMAAIAFANSDDFYVWGVREVPRFHRKTGQPVLDGDGNQVIDHVPFAAVKPSDGLTRRQKAAITGAEMTLSRTGEPLVSVKMADKRAALKDLGQHLGLFKLGVDATLSGKGGGPVQLVVSSAEEAL